MCTLSKKYVPTPVWSACMNAVGISPFEFLRIILPKEAFHCFICDRPASSNKPAERLRSNSTVLECRVDQSVSGIVVCLVLVWSCGFKKTNHICHSIRYRVTTNGLTQEMERFCLGYAAISRLAYAVICCFSGLHFL